MPIHPYKHRNEMEVMHAVFEEIFLIHNVTITFLTIDKSTVCLFFILAKY